MQYIVLYVFLAIVCIIGIQVNKPAFNNMVQIQKNANSLRGLFAIFIIFTHCTLSFQTMPMLIVPLRKVSTFGVGFFFVLSGYGLALSYYSKPNYLNGFIYNKIIKKIVLYAIVCRIVSKLLLVIFMNDSFLMSVGAFLKGINWYIYAMCVLYLIFYLVYKYVKNDKYKLIVLWSLVILITLMILYFSNAFYEIDRSYFISEWAFPFGVTLYCKREKIDNIINDHLIKTSLLMLILLAIVFILAAKVNNYTVADLITHNLMLFPFYYFVMILCKYFTFGNVILKFLNRISFERYLYQFVILIILKNRMETIGLMYFVYVTIFTILLACIINKSRQVILHIMGKK